MHTHTCIYTYMNTFWRYFSIWKRLKVEISFSAWLRKLRRLYQCDGSLNINANSVRNNWWNSPYFFDEFIAFISIEKKKSNSKTSFWIIIQISHNLPQLNFLRAQNIFTRSCQRSEQKWKREKNLIWFSARI